MNLLNHPDPPSSNEISGKKSFIASSISCAWLNYWQDLCNYGNCTYKDIIGIKVKIIRVVNNNTNEDDNLLSLQRNKFKETCYSYGLPITRIKIELAICMARHLDALETMTENKALIEMNSKLIDGANDSTS